MPNELIKIGGNLVQGLWDGINGMMSWVKDKISSFAKGITDWIKNMFGIKLPSKLFKDEIGKNLALGLGEGFSNEMNAVAKEMQNAIPNSFDYDVNPTVNRGFPNAIENPQANIMSDPDYLISAFQCALEGMAFKIDEEKVGEMVISKVERVVFA